MSEVLQGYKDEYLRETGKSLYGTKDLARWAMSTGRWIPPADLAIRKCREDFAKALREEYIKDADGKPVRVNQAARRKDDGAQRTFWGDIRTIKRDHFDAARSQRREQIVGECRQLDRDERYYNGQHLEEAPFMTEFNMTDDVIEGRYSGKLDDDGTPED